MEMLNATVIGGNNNLGFARLNGPMQRIQGMKAAVRKNFVDYAR
jgi:hypothetical protein